jgi:hypothetical protein
VLRLARDLGMTRARLQQEMSSTELTDWIAAYQLWESPGKSHNTDAPEPPKSVADEVAAFKMEFS